MKAIDRPFTNIINGTTQFVIPVLQRDYTWTESQCSQLWSDVLHAAKTSDRMPVVLKPEAWPISLGEEPADEPQLKSLLFPYRADGMVCWPVNARVGNVRNNDPSLIERINLP